MQRNTISTCDKERNKYGDPCSLFCLTLYIKSMKLNFHRYLFHSIEFDIWLSIKKVNTTVHTMQPNCHLFRTVWTRHAKIWKTNPKTVSNKWKANYWFNSKPFANRTISYEAKFCLREHEWNGDRVYTESYFFLLSDFKREIISFCWNCSRHDWKNTTFSLILTNQKNFHRFENQLKIIRKELRKLESFHTLQWFHSGFIHYSNRFISIMFFLLCIYEP